MITSCYVVLHFVLLVVIPSATFELWRADIEKREDRRHAVSALAESRVTFAVYAVSQRVHGLLASFGYRGAAASFTRETATALELRSASSKFVCNDAPQLAVFGACATATDCLMRLLSNKLVPYRVYLLLLCTVAAVARITPHLVTLYKLWVAGPAARGRTLSSSGSDASSQRNTSRLLNTYNSNKNNTPGPNIFGMSELRTTHENAALKRELDSKVPNTGLDAMLGMGLKHGATGTHGIEKFYGTGNRLGGGGGGRDNAKNPSSLLDHVEKHKESRASYEGLD